MSVTVQRSENQPVALQARSAVSRTQRAWTFLGKMERWPAGPGGTVSDSSDSVRAEQELLRLAVVLRAASVPPTLSGRAAIRRSGVSSERVSDDPRGR